MTQIQTDHIYCPRISKSRKQTKLGSENKSYTETILNDEEEEFQFNSIQKTTFKSHLGFDQTFSFFLNVLKTTAGSASNQKYSLLNKEEKQQRVKNSAKGERRKNSIFSWSWGPLEMHTRAVQRRRDQYSEARVRPQYSLAEAVVYCALICNTVRVN